jgi:tRNA-dihydrouridine synthase
MILYLAPVLGVTDFIFRSAFARNFGGFDVAVAPFVKTLQGGRHKPGKLMDLLPAHNMDLPVQPQILSNDPEDFIELAKVMEGYGYPVINLNLGCPMPTSTSRGKGAGLLPHADKIDAFFDAVLSRLNCQLSVKVRIGFEKDDDLDRLVPIFNRYPLYEIIIHPRTAAQKYGGEIAWDVFERCMRRLAHPVVYNGDITTKEGFDRLQQRFDSVTRWMIGRGALRDPFLPAALKGVELSNSDKLSKLRCFHHELAGAYAELASGAPVALARMNALWSYMGAILAVEPKILKKLTKVRSVEAYCELADDLIFNVGLAP